MLREHVICLAHEDHQGIVHTKKRLQSEVWWSDMNNMVESLFKNAILVKLFHHQPSPLQFTTKYMISSCSTYV